MLGAMAGYAPSSHQNDYFYQRPDRRSYQNDHFYRRPDRRDRLDVIRLKRDGSLKVIRL